MPTQSLRRTLIRVYIILKGLALAVKMQFAILETIVLWIYSTAHTESGTSHNETNSD